MSFRSSLAACFFVTLVPFATQAATINFDDLGNLVVVGTTYPGVTFSNARTLVTGNLPGGSPSTSIVSQSDFSMPKQSNPISAVFGSAVSFVSLTGIDVGENGFILKAFDAMIGGNLLGSTSMFGIGVGVGTFFDLSLSFSGIFRIEFSQASSVNLEDGMVFDNLVYDVTVVPVPAAGLLLLGALGGMGMLSRRRGRKAV